MQPNPTIERGKITLAALNLKAAIDLNLSVLIEESEQDEVNIPEVFFLSTL